MRYLAITIFVFSVIGSAQAQHTNETPSPGASAKGIDADAALDRIALCAQQMVKEGRGGYAGVRMVTGLLNTAFEKQSQSPDDLVAIAAQCEQSLKNYGPVQVTAEQQLAEVAKVEKTSPGVVKLMTAFAKPEAACRAALPANEKGLLAAGVRAISTACSPAKKSSIPMVAEHSVRKIKEDIIPYFFMVPKESFAHGNVPANTVEVESTASDKVGGRLFTFDSTKPREQSAKFLAESGMIQDGDILLSFRPEWVNTVAYSNLQEGVSHTGVAFIDDTGKVHSVESPLNFSSNLNSEHYQGLNFMHILRPNLTEAQRKNIRAWSKALLSSPTRAGLTFETNYQNPEYNGTYDFVRKVADIARGKSAAVSEYCSEFAFSMLALRDCDPKNYVPSCVKPYFEPMTAIGSGPDRPGMLEGPSIMLKAMGVGDQERRERLLNDVLVSKGDAKHMSENHRKTASDTKPLVDGLEAYYKSGESPAAIPLLNRALKANYPPAGFLIQTQIPNGKFKYVGTAYYQPPEKLKGLSVGAEKKPTPLPSR